MRKIFLYPQWNYAKAEKFLEDMEAQGYRLETAKCAFFFKFKKSAPKKARYVFLYNFMKDADIRHFEARDYLLGACKGNEICGKKSFEPNIFRITDEEADLGEVIKFRNAYLKRAFVFKILIAAIFFVPAILLCIFDIFNIFFAVTATFALLVIAYYTLGLVLLAKRKK